MRLTVLLVSPFLSLVMQAADQEAAYFIVGAGLWFALTAPAKFYLEAAEPPKPTDGDRISLVLTGHKLNFLPVR
ncbi:hypothetical protein PYH37_000903 [Sinorhizobium numidicum]|uniref:Uncharacterized protein n=1 Tax=Sinorhizobium numidicum TaxID=680248 RepID=A0ABY8CS64_9HYPH|nr:hypothetical protein [Sinorhizobium numidicum]WEX75484.1 hypothetical protein PYH37_000903 [Sinorhizobium numidicum]WEX81481.1 hypothetical protein PYH38_000904 [Sinorhizobium numidicum]